MVLRFILTYSKIRLVLGGYKRLSHFNIGLLAFLRITFNSLTDFI
jgi:hypothetical protein